MPRHRLSSLAVMALAGAVLAHGQSASPSADEPISTDRPSIANSSVVVPRGIFQAENGLQVISNQGQTSFDAPETSLRFGVAPRTELRLGVPDYYANLPTGQSASSSGFGDMTVGFKQQLGPVAQFDVSLILFVSLPTGASAISSHGYDPAVQLPWSRKLSGSWTASGQLAVYWPTQGATRNVTGESTFLLDRQLTKPLDAFVEYAGDFPQSGGPRHLLHFGAIYKLSPRQQVDFHVGVGLSSAAPDYFIGAGYSFRVRAIKR